MALRNQIETCRMAIGEEWSAYRTTAREGKLTVTSGLTGRNTEVRGPLAPLGKAIIGGVVELTTLLLYPFDRLVIGKSAEQIRRESEEVINLFKES